MLELIILVVVIILISKLFKQKDIESSASIKGKAGESEIAEVLEGIQGTKVFRNLYLPLNRDRTKFTEIDLVAINKSGIYVIESKNYSGVISGTREGQNWTQELGKQVYKFYNPLKQNATHCNALGYRLGRYTGYIKSIIVFGNNADIRYVKASDVINTKDLYKAMEDNINADGIELSNEQLSEISKQISQYTNASKYIKKQHIKNIKNQYR